MAKLVARFLVLIAVLLMPLAMAPSAAAHHQASAGVPMQRCPEQDRKAGVAQCTMACSAALPAIEAPGPVPAIIHHVFVPPGVDHVLDDLHPDIATPPPRMA